MRAPLALTRRIALWIAPLVAAAVIVQAPPCNAQAATTEDRASAATADMAVVAVTDAQDVASATGVAAGIRPERQPAERPSDYLEWWVETPEVADPGSPTGVALGQVGFVQSAGKAPEAFCTVYDGNLNAPDLRAIYSCPLRPLASGRTVEFSIYWAPTATDRSRWAFREDSTVLGTFDLCGKYWPVVPGSGWTDPQLWSEYDWSGAPTPGLATVTADPAIRLLQGSTWVTPASADAVGGSTYTCGVWHIAGRHQDRTLPAGSVRIGEGVAGAASGDELWP